MKYLVSVGVIAFCLVILSGCAGMGCCGDSSGCCKDTAGCESCAMAESGGTGWCADCGIGIFDGEKVACEGCFKEMTGGSACPKCNL